MGNIIEGYFNPKQENNKYEMKDNQLRAVVNKGLGLSFGSMTPNTFMVSMRGQSEAVSREELAELLWMAAYMLDSEQRWCGSEYVGMNYPKTDK